MSTRTSFLRYTLIIKILRNSRNATWEEINRYLLDKSDYSNELVQISKRTFQRDLNEIRSLFGIDIQCNTLYQYYIAEECQQEFNTRMLEAFDVFNSLSMGQPLSPYILTENHCPAGTEHLFRLLHAIRNNFVVRFNYQKYYEDEPTARTVQPLGMKEFRGRWYLVARHVVDRKIRVFGTDRIHDLEVTTKNFPYPSDFNLAEYFKHSFGVTRPDDQQPEEIILSFKPVEGKYTKAFPLHHSQEILLDNEKEFRIRIRVLITYDLIMELRSYGKTLTVIQPKDLLKE